MTERNYTPLCIYHANCMDGFTAAWVVDKALKGNVEFFEGHYGKPAPDCKNRNVIIVDFSYKRDTMLKIISEADTVLVLDHHKTAQEELKDLRNEHNFNEVIIQFDTNRSGATMAWDYFFSFRDIPYFVACVEDRDLWKFKLNDTREIHAFMSAFEMSFKQWDIFERMDIDEMAETGKVLLTKFNKDLKSMLQQGVHLKVVHGYEIPCCNLHGIYASEGGNQMLDISEGQYYPFSMTWFDTAQHRKFSLRSHDNGMDVSEIARQYGGGGHRNAAGFSLPLGEWPRKE